MSDQRCEQLVGSAVVIEVGEYADTPGRVVAQSSSGRMLDVLTSEGIVTVRRSSVEVY